jgi:hypothetical protein
MRRTLALTGVLLVPGLVWGQEILIPPTGNVYEVKIKSADVGPPAEELCLVYCAGSEPFSCIPAGAQGSEQVITTTQDAGVADVCVRGIARNPDQVSEPSISFATLLARLLAPILGN